MLKKFLSLLVAVVFTQPLFAQTPHTGLYGPEIKRIEGRNNGNNILELNQVSEDSIISNYYMINPVYKSHNAPVMVSLYNPDSATAGTYRIQFDGIDSASTWKIYRVGSTDTAYSSLPLGQYNNQYISSMGILVSIERGDYIIPKLNMNEPTEVTVDFMDTTNDWLTFVADTDGVDYRNWIRAGNRDTSCNTVLYPQIWNDPCTFNDFTYKDSLEYYETVTNRIIAPYTLCSISANYDGNSVEHPLGAPISKEFSITNNADPYGRQMSIDIVFTDDKSKWTRCPVIEMCEEQLMAENGAKKQRLRRSLSVDKNGLNALDSGYNAAEGDYNGLQPYGMGWFPGYAIDLEKGIRCNMAFGENSWLAVDNGRDMVFNPSERTFDGAGFPVFGGRHYIYVFEERNSESPVTQFMERYDGGYNIHDKLMYTNYAANSINSGNYIRVWRSARWVTIPLLKQGHNYLETETLIRVRTKLQRKTYVSETADTLNNGNPFYEFEITQANINTVPEFSIQNFHFSVYPNPNSGEFFIAIDPAECRGTKTIRIYDISGKCVYSENTVQNNIRISGLSSGMYNICISGNRYYASEKILVR
ncbi:MAG: T9SS type A sorting domain-containing protein [Bacteroidota bacterium]